MEAVKTIFLNSVEQNQKSSNLFTIISELVCNLASKKLQNLSSEESAQKRLAQLFGVFVSALDEAGAKNSKTVSAVIEGLIRAAGNDKKQYLLKTIYEKEQLEASIRKQSSELQSLIARTYDTIANAVGSLECKSKAEIIEGLNDAKLLNVEMLGILKEAAEEAFITTLEKAYDVEDTVREISKSFVYLAINEGRFTKARVLGIAGVVIEAARDIADSDQANAPMLLNGAADGAKEGISKAITKLRNELRFAPDEATNDESRKDAIGMEEDFIAMLRRLQGSSEGISAKILSQVVERQNIYLVKLKRFSAEAAEALSEKIENFKDEGFRELKEKAGKKFEEIKKGTSEKYAAIKSDAAPKAIQAANDAKNLGFRAWEAAKSALDEALKNAKERGKKDKK